MKKIGIYRISNGYCTRVGEAYDYGEARHRAECLTHETGYEHTIDGMNDRPVISLRSRSITFIDEQKCENISNKNSNRDKKKDEESEDNIEEESEEEESEEPKKSDSKILRKGCCLLFILIGFIIFSVVVIIIIGIIFDDKEGDKNVPPISETNKEIIKDKISSEIKDKDEMKAGAEPEKSSVPSNKETNKLNTDENKISTFENTSLPLILITTDVFYLLDKSGKETVIPIGTKITIVKRRSQGTLEIYIDADLYVGNESRILGKYQIN